MNDKFDELAKGMAQSVTRRGALRKFGVGFAGIALACFGLANKAQAGRDTQCVNQCKRDCAKIYRKDTFDWQVCWTDCAGLHCPTPV